VDGALNSKSFGTGTIFTTLKGSLIEQSFTLDFPGTNNEAKYEAVFIGLKMAVTLGATGLEVSCNSLMVVSQVKEKYNAKDEQMAAYLQLILSLKLKFLRCDFRQISRSENNYADSLANLGSTVEY